MPALNYYGQWCIESCLHTLMQDQDSIILGVSPKDDHHHMEH